MLLVEQAVTWRIVPGDVAPVSLDELYRTHAPAAFRRARRLLGNDAAAHDLVQDLFVSFLERPEQFEGRSTFSTFLYSSVTHACLNRLRDHKNRVRLLEQRSEQAPLHALRGASPEQLATLQEVLAEMPEPLAQVAVYHHLDELSQADIARILGCSRRRVVELLGRLADYAQKEAPACPS